MLENAGLTKPSLTVDPELKPRAAIQGVHPKLLIEQVKNTVPFIFEEQLPPSPALAYLSILKNADKTLKANPDAILNEDIFKYFALNLSAHYATIASFVPIDIDNQIRLKIWQHRVDTGTLQSMADLIRTAASWNTKPMTTRILIGPESGESMSSHNGEWFSVAVAAYGATKRRLTDVAKTLVEMLIAEIRREFAVYAEVRKAKDGQGILKASAIIARNLDDLNRVMDMWNLNEEDFLRKALYQELDTKDLKKFNSEITGLNRGYMADENHRHYPLRAVKCLRADRSLLLPIGPFFDDWGKVVAKHKLLTPKDIGNVVLALTDGWIRLAGPVGYSRALAGILDSFPGGINELKEFIPARTARMIKSGALRGLCNLPQDRFEGHWQKTALKFLEL